MAAPLISVIIPALNATAVLPQQLDAMLGQNPSEHWELVVVDNGSEDATAELAESYSDRLPIRVASEPTRGINRARNAGLAETTGQKVLFTDADDIVGPQWVETMAGAVKPGLVVGGWLDRRHLPPDPPRTLDPEPVSAVFRGEWLPYPIGCCMAWHRGVLDMIGGFDDELLYGGDEVDAIWRAQLLGAEVVQADRSALIIRRERAEPATLRRQARTFGKAEAILARRYAAHGHPGKLRRRSAWRAAKAAARLSVRRGPSALENRRKLAFHSAAARQVARHALRLDPIPEAASLRR